MPEGEVWRDVVGFEGLYKISNKGNVYSVERISTNNRKFGGITLKPKYDKDGYLGVVLCKDGERTYKRVHRLVAEMFIHNPNNYPEVNHRDEVKFNNNVENLEWCDTRYNSNYGTRNERLSKKVRAVNIKTGEVLTFSSTVEAGNKGYNSGNVAKACRGTYKNARGKLIGGGHLYRGHTWYYEEENK